MVQKPDLTPHWESNFQLKVQEKGQFDIGQNWLE